MKRRPKGAIPLRRVTLATRLLRARLSRERQGPDGKWESNKKKNIFRLTTRKCKNINTAFEAMDTQRQQDEAAALDTSKQLVEELDRVVQAKDLCELMPRLEGLVVTVAVLRQSPSILFSLLNAAKRCRKSKDASVKRLLTSWQQLQREDYKNCLKEGQHTKRSLSTKSSGSSLPVAVNPVPRPPATPQVASQSTQVVRNCKKLDSRPSMQLGSLFDCMQAKRVAEEAAALAAMPCLTSELVACSSAVELRNLLPHLEALTVTPKVLQQLHSMQQALEAAAKRFPKHNCTTVARLLEAWRNLQTEQRGKMLCSIAVRPLGNATQEAAPVVQSSILKLSSTLKQPKITKFIANKDDSPIEVDD